MTRFLSRIWDDPLCGSFNKETERLFAYHQATKHTYQSVRIHGHFLDWKNQPDPFRSYEGAPIIILPPGGAFPNTGTFAAIAALDDKNATIKMSRGNELELHEEIPLDQNLVSRLLWHSMAISARKKVPGTENRYSLRVNPSSGNLHPTETYLALRGFDDIGDGLYHYRADSHALELRSPGAITQQLAQALRIPWAQEPQLIVGLTSVFWREAWKYRDRAYRYCCHDMGHAMMSLLLAARAVGLSGAAIAHFGDTRLARALGLAGGDEAPMAFLVFPSPNASEDLPATDDMEFSGTPNELSPQEVPYELLLEIHRATILPDSVNSLPIPPMTSSEEPPTVESRRAPAVDAPLGIVARRRRSALDFDPRTPSVERAHLEQLLDFATRDWSADWRGNFNGQALKYPKGADFVTLFLYVHRVNGCESGVYKWNASSCSLEQLHCANVERVAAYLSLEQSLAGNSCFTVSMIANLAEAAQVFGNRGYRYIHFEAGAIGQRLYLGAEALGWNATGIGAFYDDDVHRYLGLLEEGNSRVNASIDSAERSALVMLDSPAGRYAATHERNSSERASVKPRVETAPVEDSKILAQQVIYHFAVGCAIPDPRIEG